MIKKSFLDFINFLVEAFLMLESANLAVCEWRDDFDRRYGFDPCPDEMSDSFN